MLNSLFIPSERKLIPCFLFHCLFRVILCTFTIQDDGFLNSFSVWDTQFPQGKSSLSSLRDNYLAIKGFLSLNFTIFSFMRSCLDYIVNQGYHKAVNGNSLILIFAKTFLLVWASHIAISSVRQLNLYLGLFNLSVFTSLIKGSSPPCFCPRPVNF